MSPIDPSFDSPLRITEPDSFSGIDFGPIEEAGEITALRGRLMSSLLDVVELLPQGLRAEARGILEGYAEGGEFYRLFYVPIWSFLHWIPAAASSAVDPAMVDAACDAHAMALFLHLWDDHLCDGQLAIDPLRLHLRTVAWMRFEERCRLLHDLAGGDPALFREHADIYLTTLHAPSPAADLDGYALRAPRQLAIWTVVPRLLARAAGGAGAERALRSIVESFEIAWRLLDDLQDCHADCATGAVTAVSIELDALPRANESGQPDQENWSELAARMRAGGIVDRLLGRIDGHLLSAGAVARAQGWEGLARELDAGRDGIVTASRREGAIRASRSIT